GLDREPRLAVERADEVAALFGELDEEGAVGGEIHPDVETTKHTKHTKNSRTEGLDFVWFVCFVVGNAVDRAADFLRRFRGQPCERHPRVRRGRGGRREDR